MCLLDYWANYRDAVQTCQVGTGIGPATRAILIYPQATPSYQTIGYVFQNIKLNEREGDNTFDEVGLEGLAAPMQQCIGPDLNVQLEKVTLAYQIAARCFNHISHSMLCGSKDWNTMEDTSQQTQRSGYWRIRRAYLKVLY